MVTGTGVSSFTKRLEAEGATAGGVRTGVGAETGWSSGTNLEVVATGVEYAGAGAGEGAGAEAMKSAERAKASCGETVTGAAVPTDFLVVLAREGSSDGACFEPPANSARQAQNTPTTKMM